MLLKARIEVWAQFIDEGGIDDLIAEVRDWVENTVALYDDCKDLLSLGKIQGIREASGDFIGLLEELKERLPEIYEEQEDESGE